MGAKGKSRGGRIALIVVGVIAGLIILSIAVTVFFNLVSVKKSMSLIENLNPVVNEDMILPVKDENGNWYYKTDRDLKIVQITDIHLGGGCFSARQDAMAISAVASMVTAEKPDLVVITGDLIFPVPFISGSLANKRIMNIAVSLMEKLQVPWIPVFGNHDSEAYNFSSREEIADFLENGNFRYCLFKKGPEDVDGYGNSVITVRNSRDIITHSLFFIDSHDYLEDDPLGIKWHYDNIHQNQIDWYKNCTDEINSRNKSLYPGEQPADTAQLLFFHIPVFEYKEAWDKYLSGEDKSIKLYYGTVGEKGGVISCPANEDSLFETMQTMGGSRGMFCGHDHLNTFSMDYKGIRLTFGMSIDYLAYRGIREVGSQRGCTLITLKTDGSFDSEASNYYQDKYNLPGYIKETVTMQDLAENRKVS